MKKTFEYLKFSTVNRTLWRAMFEWFIQVVYITFKRVPSQESQHLRNTKNVICIALLLYFNDVTKHFSFGCVASFVNDPLPGWRGRSSITHILGAVDLATVQYYGADTRQAGNQIFEDAVIDELVVWQVDLFHTGQGDLQHLDLLWFEQWQS